MRLNLGFGLVGVALAVAIAVPIASSAVSPAAAQTVGPQDPSRASGKKASSKAKSAAEGKSARSPAETDRILDSAAKSISDGNLDAAMTALDGVLAGGGLANKHMARALYLRGVAHRRKGQPAQAIADLTSAIWLKDGLNDADRSAAQAARNEVSREVGVADTTAPEGPARAESVRPAVAARAEPTGAPSAPPSASPRVISAPLPVSQPTAPSGSAAPPRFVAAPPPLSSDVSEGGFPPAGAPAAPAVATSPTAARRTVSASDLTEGGLPRSYATTPQQSASPPPSTPAPSSTPSAAPSGGIGSGLGEFFSGFFTGNSPSSSSSQAGPAKKTAEVSAWSTSTDKKAVPKSDRIVTSSTPREPAVVADGKFRLQIAAVRSRKEAETVAARVKQDYARVIGARKLEVDETVFGNMGTFYRVRLGPFAAADEPKALCDTLRSSGYDCLVVSQ